MVMGELASSSASLDLGRADTWSALGPHLHVNDKEFVLAHAPLALDAAAAKRLPETLIKEGYGRWHPPRWNLDLAGLARAIGAIDAAGLPATFCYVYDETWLVFLKLRSLLTTVLGEGYRILPDFWAWHVAARDDDSGWAPHRDRGGAVCWRTAVPGPLPSGCP